MSAVIVDTSAILAIFDGGAAGAVRDPFAGAVEAACLEKLFEGDPVWDPGPVAAQRVGGVIAGPVGQQRGKLVPQRFDQP